MKVIFLVIKIEKRKAYIFYILLILFLFHNINSEIKQCPKETPILISGECLLDYCTNDSSDCIIANSTIKTQWLNKLIVFGDLKYRYINFATYENGDMVVETTDYPDTQKRMFFGISQNGRPFFTKDGENIFFSTNANNDEGKFEAQGLIIKISSDESNEYFMSDQN